MQKKSVLRQSLLEERLELSGSQVNDFSNKIIKKLIDYINWDEINTIYIYRTIESHNEVDTRQFIDFVKQNYPDIIIDIAENKISAGKNIPVNKNYDLVIVPMLGFDRRGHRLGYGGGYYDKFLAKNNCQQVIGLAYSFCELPEIPDEPHDQKMHKVITEKEIINTN